MLTLGDLAKALNRPAVVLHGWQNRFALPTFEGAAYSDAYLAFLRTVTFLRTLYIGEDALLKLWEMEKKLLQLLYVDCSGSPTWFLDARRPDPRRPPARTQRRRQMTTDRHSRATLFFDGAFDPLSLKRHRMPLGGSIDRAVLEKMRPGNSADRFI